jgi:hypothetical protein
VQARLEVRRRSHGKQQVQHQTVLARQVNLQAHQQLLKHNLHQSHLQRHR